MGLSGAMAQEVAASGVRSAERMDILFMKITVISIALQKIPL